MNGEQNAKVGADRTGAPLSPPPDPTSQLLPPLREELTLHPGPSGADGAPNWSLQDPVRNLFFRIDWPTFEVLSRWELGTAVTIAEALATETTLQVDADDVFGVLAFLSNNELLRVTDAASSQRYNAIAQRRHSGWGHWLLHHYLFFRVPLFRPDHLLEQMLSWVAPLYTRGFLQLTLLALLVGVIEVTRQWESFSATLIDTFTWQGLALYGLALVFVKTLHEFSHGLTAKRFGCRVPVMGVAFLVMFPMAYTDVNEVWKLPDRRRRFFVSGAGILTELILAAWATLAWALLPDGTLRGIAFLLCTTTWISTLAINASPFMRFDGYFLLTDWLDMPNLHERSFALARWRMREWLFGLGDPPPEHLSPLRQRGLIVFAYVTWLYRLVIFIGIAVLVYEFFIKLLGIVLFVVEIGWFIVRPAWLEIKVWHQRKEDLRKGKYTRRTLIGVAAMLVLVVIPWRFQIEAQGILRPMQSYPIVTPAAARIVALPVPHSARVVAQASLLLLESPELTMRQTSLTQRVSTLRWQVAAASVDASQMARRPVLNEELASATSELVGIEQEILRLAPLAPFDGMLVDLPPEMAPGQWLPRNTQIAQLVSTHAWRVETFLTESDVERVVAGDWGRFIPETPGGPNLWLKLDRVDRDASRTLTEPMLAATRGGQMLARESGQTIVTDHAIYRVSLQVITDTVPEGVLRGKVIIYGSPKTPAVDFFRAATGLLIREAGI